MRLRCRREELLAAVQLASVVVPTRDIKPVLLNLKAAARPGRCSLLATDREVGLRLDVNDLAVDQPGEALLPAKRVLDILRESPDDDLTIEADAHACLIRGRNNEFEMASDDPAHFPDVPAFASDQYHEMQARTLREMIRRTVFAAAGENIRYALTGTLWEPDGGTVRLVATYGQRLAVAQEKATPIGDYNAKGQPHVVPTRAMQLLERNLRDLGETIRVSLRPNEALFQTGRATIYTRLVEGRYPAWKDVIPKKPTAKVSVVRGTFLAAVRQAAVMADNESRKVEFSFAKGRLTLQAQRADSGRSRVELPIDYQGKGVEIAFDPRLLSDMLRALEAADEPMLEMTGGQSPARFRCGDDYSYVVMPLA